MDPLTTFLYVLAIGSGITVCAALLVLIVLSVDKLFRK